MLRDPGHLVLVQDKRVLLKRTGTVDPHVAAGIFPFPGPFEAPVLDLMYMRMKLPSRGP